MSAKKIVIAIILAVVVVGGFSTGGLMYISSQTKEFDQVFLDGVYIEEMPVGGLTKEEAKVQLLEMLKGKDEGKTIVVHGEGRELTIPVEKFAPEYNIDEVLEEAFEIGHDGGMIKRYRTFKNNEITPEKFTLDQSYNKEIAEESIKQYAEEVYVAPQDATMVRKNKEFVITPEQSGREMDVKATSKKINDLYDTEGEGKVEAVMIPLEPKRKSDFFAQVQSPIASFYTSFNNADLGRNENLKIGAQTINTPIEPGEIFALSDYLEPISAQNGYKSSKVIVNGKLVDGIGGGICQVASTLYNSVLLTDLEIISRQNHSMPVGYIPLGRDATYASNIIDFKFKNPTEYPVYVESYIENNRLYVNIFGNKSLKPDHDVKFETEIVEVVPPPETKYEDDPNLPKGVKERELAPLDGKRVKLYKLLYENGKVVDRVLESSSYYRPRGEVIRVGTKEVPKEQPEPDQPKEEEEEEKNLEEPEKPIKPREQETIDDSSMMDLYEEQI